MHLTPSRNFAGHHYIFEHLKTVMSPKGHPVRLQRLRRMDAIGQLLSRVRCSKKVQRAAKRAGLSNPKWQGTGKIVAQPAA